MRIGVRSAPPANQPCRVISMRVFICTAGTSGLCGCATRLMPEAQNRGSSAAPGTMPRNSGLNSPQTVETFTPTFSKTRPCMTLIAPPPPSMPSGVGRRQPRRSNRPAGRSASGPACSASIISKLSQIRSRKVSNQACARARSAACPVAPSAIGTAPGALASKLSDIATKSLCLCRLPAVAPVASLLPGIAPGF
jgi:hypothetical protein